MHELSGLKNSFAISFGLKGDMEEVSDKGRKRVWKLTLYVDDFDKKYLSEDEAKEIFDLVTKAFIMGNKQYHHYYGATYEFDRENLTVIETVDLDNRGEWL